MYLDHFGLRELPFRLTPLTEFFFSGAKRGATVDALVYAVLHDEGIVKVGGEVGSGKTMLCRVLIERLPEKVDTVYFANPTLAPQDLLLTIAHELGLDMASGQPGVLLGLIQDELIKRHAAGRRVVALIDEAHAMPRDSLEQIRLLSNLETGRHKLLQIVLFGQPELDSILAAHPMRPLKDRITHHFNLNPLSSDEVIDYLDFRMRAAGFRGPTVFSPASSRKIARYAAGLTRRVNVLADKSLLAAFSQNLHAVNPAHVKAAARDAQYLPRKMRRPGWLSIPVTFLLSVVFAWQAFSHLASSPTPDATFTAPPATDAKVSPVPPDAASAAPVAPPLAETQEERSAPAKDTANVAGEPGTDAGPVAAALASPAHDASASAPAPTRSVEAPPPTPPAGAPEPAESGAALVQAAEASLITWLETADNRTWFIQLHTNMNAAPSQLEAQVQGASSALGQPVRVYRASLPAGERTGVIVGDYRSEQAAYAALATLPQHYRNGGAYVRPIRHLR